jgi:hypothetical protein
MEQRAAEVASPEPTRGVPVLKLYFKTTTNRIELGGQPPLLLRCSSGRAAVGALDEGHGGLRGVRREGGLVRDAEVAQLFVFLMRLIVGCQ